MTEQDMATRRGRPRRKSNDNPRPWIEEARIAAGLTQEQLGKLCDPIISQNHISNIERGRSNINQQYENAIAKALNQTAAWVRYGPSQGRKTVRILGKTRGDDAISLEQAEEEEGLRRFALDDEIEGYRVGVDFLAPRFHEGDILLCRSEGLPIADCLWRWCIVDLPDGHRYVRQVDPGASARVVVLRPVLPTTPLMVDVQPQRICPIIAIIPKR